MKKLLIVMLMFWVGLVKAETYVFVSYSMPDNALKAYFKEAQELGATLVMRGLKDDSFIASGTKSQELGITYDINPDLFEQYKIELVPVIVVSKGRDYDKIQGHISLREAIKIMAG